MRKYAGGLYAISMLGVYAKCMLNVCSCMPAREGQGETGRTGKIMRMPTGTQADVLL